MRFAEKVAVVTGGNAGIGRAIALKLVREGAKIAIVARNAERASVVLREVEKLNGEGCFVACDVTDSEQCRQAVDETVKRFGRINILVNNSGIAYRMRDVARTSVEEWQQTFAVNVHGMFYMCKYAIPHLVESKGSVVNMASYLGLVGVRDMVAYCASKGAVVQMTKAMALDHAEAGVRVNCVCPGTVETDMIATAWDEYGEGAEAVWKDKHPLKRISTPDEIANVICFLASDDASFITGAAIPIDGGITAG